MTCWPCGCCSPLPGRTPHEARSNFLGPLQRVLSCLTGAQLYYRQAPVGESEALLVSDDPVALRCRGGAVLKLSIGHRYTLVETDERQLGPWKATTRAYLYRLDDGEGQEQVSWHWHPSGRSRFDRPHLHVGAGHLAGRHLPTGRVSIESVVRLLLGEMDVVSRRSDWVQVLDDAEGNFLAYRTWG